MDYAGNKLERFQDRSRTSRKRMRGWILGTALGLGLTGLVAVGYKMDMPYARQTINYATMPLRDIKNYINHDLCNDTIEVKITHGMTIDGLGESKGLRGRDIVSWRNAVINHNLGLINRPEIGVTGEGKLIEGKKVEILNCY